MNSTTDDNVILLSKYFKAEKRDNTFHPEVKCIGTYNIIITYCCLQTTLVRLCNAMLQKSSHIVKSYKSSFNIIVIEIANYCEVVRFIYDWPRYCCKSWLFITQLHYIVILYIRVIIRVYDTNLIKVVSIALQRTKFIRIGLEFDLFSLSSLTIFKIIDIYLINC